MTPQGPSLRRFQGPSAFSTLCPLSVPLAWPGRGRGPEGHIRMRKPQPPSALLWAGRHCLQVFTLFCLLFSQTGLPHSGEHSG